MLSNRLLSSHDEDGQQMLRIQVWVEVFSCPEQ